MKKKRGEELQRKKKNPQRDEGRSLGEEHKRLAQ